MTVTFRGSTQLINLDQSNPFRGFAEIAVLGDATREYDNGEYAIHTHNVTMMTAGDITAFLAAGGSVEQLPVFIKMSPTIYSQNVPATISNHAYTDENNNEITRTWSEWKDNTHEHMDAADGDKIVPGNSWGQELSAAELQALNGSSDYTLLLAHEVAQHLPSS